VPSSVRRFFDVQWPDINILSMAWETSFGFFDFIASTLRILATIWSALCALLLYNSILFSKLEIL